MSRLIFLHYHKGILWMTHYKGGHVLWDGRAWFRKGLGAGEASAEPMFAAVVPRKAQLFARMISVP